MSRMSQVYVTLSQASLRPSIGRLFAFSDPILLKLYLFERKESDICDKNILRTL